MLLEFLSGSIQNVCAVYSLHKHVYKKNPVENYDLINKCKWFTVDHDYVKNVQHKS